MDTPLTAAELLATRHVTRMGTRTLLCRLREQGFRLADHEYAQERERQQREVERLSRDGIRVIGFFETDYPASLRALPDPPLVLYARGDVSLLGRGRKLSVVRHPSPLHLRDQRSSDLD